MKGLECLCAKLKCYIPLPIPLTDDEINELAARIAESMKKCCVKYGQYIQSYEPDQLVLIFPNPDCDSSTSLVVTFTTVVTGAWTVSTCVIELQEVFIEVNTGTIVKQITVDCERCKCGNKGCGGCEEKKCDCGYKGCGGCEEKKCGCGYKGCGGCEQKNCGCGKKKCGGDKSKCCGKDKCQKKCCTYYREYEYCKKYIPTESDDDEFDTCCDNSGLKCRPICEYPDLCFNEPKLSYAFGSYNPCDNPCDEISGPVARLLALPFKPPFKIRKHKGCVYYLIESCNYKYLDDRIKYYATLSSNGYYKIKASDVEDMTGMLGNDPTFRFLDVVGMWFIISVGSSSEFYLKLKPGQSTKFKKIATIITNEPDHVSYRGFLDDAFKCEW